MQNFVNCKHRARLASAPFYRDLPSSEVVRARTAIFLTARAVDAQTTAKPEVMSDGHDRKRTSDHPLFRWSCGRVGVVCAGQR